MLVKIRIVVPVLTERLKLELKCEIDMFNRRNAHIMLVVHVGQSIWMTNFPFQMPHLKWNRTTFVVHRVSTRRKHAPRIRWLIGHRHRNAWRWLHSHWKIVNEGNKTVLEMWSELNWPTVNSSSNKIWVSDYNTECSLCHFHRRP